MDSASGAMMASDGEGLGSFSFPFLSPQMNSTRSSIMEVSSRMAGG